MKSGVFHDFEDGYNQITLKVYLVHFYFLIAGGFIQHIRMLRGHSVSLYYCSEHFL